MFTLLYLGPTIFGIKYNLIHSELRDIESGEAGNRMQHYTLLFQTFMMMNIFNMFNARKLSSVEEPEYNVFSRLHHNWWFLIVFLVEINI